MVLEIVRWLNLVFVGVAGSLVFLWRRHVKQHGSMAHEMEGDGPIKTVAAYGAMAVMAGGLLWWAFVGAAG